MKYLRQVKTSQLPGKGRFWRPRNSGYTGVITSAGLYDADNLAPCHAASVNYDEIPALPAIEAEIAKVKADLEFATSLAEAKIAELDKMRAMCVWSGE